jgi:hypothetical protein
LRVFGAGSAAAWWGHAAVAIAAVAAAMGLAVARQRLELQAAALATASFLVTPYSELNDLALLMVPWAFLCRDGAAMPLRPFDKIALALALLLPLIDLLLRQPLRAYRLLPSWAGLGPLTCVLLAAVIGRRLYQPALPAFSPARREQLRG